MSTSKRVAALDTQEQAEQHEIAELQRKTTFGFWLYLMTDCMLFASLFATYAVLHNNTAGGPGAQDLFEMPFVLTETMLLLTSSFTCGLALLAAHRRETRHVLMWLAITALLGLGFLGMEIHEFAKLVHEGASWQRSGFLSAFFTLVATHGLHITSGLIWAVVLGVQIARKGLYSGSVRRLALFSLFWHFLDIIWIFIFTIVYLMGVSS
jgi:cytochrome o ubiquinol oxidase subunit 3